MSKNRTHVSIQEVKDHIPVTRSILAVRLGTGALLRVDIAFMRSGIHTPARKREHTCTRAHTHKHTLTHKQTRIYVHKYRAARKLTHLQLQSQRHKRCDKFNFSQTLCLLQFKSKLIENAYN